MSSNATTTLSSPNAAAGLTFKPSYSANAFFLAMFVVLFVANLFFCGRHWRYWSHAIGLLCGLLLELLGYTGKLQLSRNRENKSAYIMYIIGLVLGPTFLSASLYLCCGRLRAQLSPGQKVHTRIGPRVYATIFMLGDFLCLCFVGVGGSLAAIFASSPIGVDLMIAGLATQILITLFFSLSLWRIARLTSSAQARCPIRQQLRCTILAALCLFIRSCWRVAELSGGFNGPLTAKEGIFIALDSIPMLLMSLILTWLHPQLWLEDIYVESTEMERHKVSDWRNEVGTRDGAIE